MLFLQKNDNKGYVIELQELFQKAGMVNLFV